MFLSSVKSFLHLLNKDAIVFLGMRIGSIVLGVVSIILLCRAVTIQYFFLTDGLGQLYDMLPLGPLAYSIVWSVISIILPGCKRKYHPALDVGLDFCGWALTFAAGAFLLVWSTKDAYELEICRAGYEIQCTENAPDLSSTEQSGAILLFLSGVTHLVMFIRAIMAVLARRKKYVPSRNSFMQLRKDTDQSLSITPLELNASTFIAADAKVRSENSSDSSIRLETTNTTIPTEHSPV